MMIDSTFALPLPTYAHLPRPAHHACLHCPRHALKYATDKKNPACHACGLERAVGLDSGSAKEFITI